MGMSEENTIKREIHQKKLLNYLKQMTHFERIWLLSFSCIILASTIVFSILYTDFTNFFSILLNWVVSPLSALSGVLCVVLVARGSIYNWILGLINVVTYGLLALISGFYGDVLINWIFFLPTQFLILLRWRKNIRPQSQDIIRMKKLRWSQFLMISLIGVGVWIGYAFILDKIDIWVVNQLKINESIYDVIEVVFGFALAGPIFDAASEVLQIGGQILCIKRYAEQWLLWIGTDVLSIIMWISVIVVVPSSLAYSVPTLIMWIAYLINAFYGASVWYKSSESPLE